MARTGAFEKYSPEYEEWFIDNEDIYNAEIAAIKEVIPIGKYGMEVGVGTGRFALPFGINLGIEPCIAMAERAIEKGILIVRGTAESLPFKDGSFDYLLMVTTICFVDDIVRSFQEAFRVLKNGGGLITGFVDSESLLGREYIKRKEKSKFYQEATFYSTDQVLSHLKSAGFGEFMIKQTIFPDTAHTQDVVRDGYGEGSFVVIKGDRKDLSKVQAE